MDGQVRKNKGVLGGFKGNVGGNAWRPTGG